MNQNQISEKPFIGLCGIGYWGKNLFRDLNSLNVLHSACDTRFEVWTEYERQYKHQDYPRITCNWNNILEDPEVTAVVIALPAEMHYTFTKQALLAGKDVFVEKPMSLHVKEAEELCKLAEQHSKLLMVGHVLRYHPCIQKMIEIVHSGELGAIRYIHCSRKNLGKIRQEENVLWSFAPHDISVVMALLNGTKPLHIHCNGQKHLHPDIHDVTDTHMEFPGNCHAHISVNWLFPMKEQVMHVVGTKGMLTFDDQKPLGEKLVRCSEYISYQPGSVPIATKPTFEKVICDWGGMNQPLYRECNHFVECCRNRTQPITNGKEGLIVLKILDACHNKLTGNVVEYKKEEDYYTHPTAIVENNAKIGKGSKIWHYSHVMKAKIGQNCSIGQNCFIGDNAIVGDHCKVQNNVSIYDGVECEDDVFLGPSMVFCNDKTPRSAFPKHGKYLKTLVKKGASIGANATILPGVTLGEYCFVGAGSVVTKDVEPSHVVVGNPAVSIGTMTPDGHMVKNDNRKM